MAADAQRNDLRLDWVAPTRADLEQARADARATGVDIDQVGDRLDQILLRLVPPPDPPAPTPDSWELETLETLADPE